MPMTSICPSCGASYQVSEKAVGRTTTCPKCQTKFTITEPKPQEPDDNGGFEVIDEKPSNDNGGFEVIDEKPAPKKSSRSLDDVLGGMKKDSKRARQTEDDEDAPKSRRRETTFDEDEDDRPRRRRPRDDDEDDDERPRRRGQMQPKKSNPTLYIILGVVGAVLLTCGGCTTYFVLKVRRGVKQFEADFQKSMKDIEANTTQPGADGWADVSDVSGKYRILLPGSAYKMTVPDSTPSDTMPYCEHSSSNAKLQAKIASYPGKSIANPTVKNYSDRLKQLDENEFDDEFMTMDSQTLGKAGTHTALIVRYRPKNPNENNEYRITVLVVTAERSYVMTLTCDNVYPSETELKKMLDSFQIK
jgi:hypothetical protein